MGGWVAGLIENITNSAQLRLGLGLSLVKILAYDSCKYIKKLELGKKIYEIINKNEIYQESLLPQ